MAFTPKDWKDDPDSSTPLSAAALEDLETRVTDYTDEELAAHLADSSAAHAASAISYAGGTGMSATDVEAAIDELATEKQNAGAAAGGVLAGTYPNPSFAADMATQAELDAHVADSSAAHAASAISYGGGTGMSATDVEAAVDELATEKANASDLTAHIDDTTDAHDATAISYAGGTGISAAHVEGAIDELATEKQDASVISGNGKGFVNHGATAGTARPSGFASIEWIGSVEPSNAVNGDTWVNTA